MEILVPTVEHFVKCRQMRVDECECRRAEGVLIIVFFTLRSRWCKLYSDAYTTLVALLRCEKRTGRNSGKRRTINPSIPTPTVEV